MNALRRATPVQKTVFVLILKAATLAHVNQVLKKTEISVRTSMNALIRAILALEMEFALIA